MAYLKIGNYPKHEENPFIPKVINEVEIKKKTQIIRPGQKSVIQSIVDDDGVATGHTAFHRYVEVDEEKFVKIFLSQFGVFWDLKRSAIRVFDYVLNQLKPDCDRFTFKMPEAKKHTSYKNDASVLSGLANLIDCEIIARSNHYFEYFINPTIAFNGSRVTFAKTYMKRQSPSDIKAYQEFKTLGD